MFKIFKLSLFVFYLAIWNISSAEETRLLEDATPAPSSFESDFSDEPEVIIRKDGESV